MSTNPTRKLGFKLRWARAVCDRLAFPQVKLTLHLVFGAYERGRMGSIFAAWLRLKSAASAAAPPPPEPPEVVAAREALERRVRTQRQKLRELKLQRETS